jgi:hypothetical protein
MMPMNKAIGWLILVVVLGIAAFLYFWPEEEKPRAPPAPEAQPAIRHPIEEAVRTSPARRRHGAPHDLVKKPRPGI